MEITKENENQDLVNEEEEEEDEDEEEEEEEDEEEEEEEEEGEEEEDSVEFIGPSDVLLGISEQNWIKEQEPVDSSCYSGWDDAVYGWGRVAPLSCILLNEKKCHKQKQKETDSPTPLPAEPTPSNAGSSASTAERSSESHEDLQKVKKPMFSNQQKGTGSQMSASAQQSDAADCAEGKCNKQTHKGTENPTPLPAEPMTFKAGSSESISQQIRECGVGLYKGKKSILSNQRKEAESQMSASAQQSAAAEWADFNAVQTNMAHLSTGEKTEEEGALRGTARPSDCLSFKYIVPAIRPAKLHKHSHRLSDTVLPIKSITFLPPIKSPQLKLRKVSEWDVLEEDCLTLNGKSGQNGETWVGMLSKPHLHAFSTSLSSKYQTRQLNPRFFSTPSVSVPRRYRVPVSFKAETVHRTDCTMGSGITQAIAQPHLHPSCLFS